MRCTFVQEHALATLWQELQHAHRRHDPTHCRQNELQPVRRQVWAKGGERDDGAHWFGEALRCIGGGWAEGARWLSEEATRDCTTQGVERRTDATDIPIARVRLPVEAKMGAADRTHASRVSRGEAHGWRSREAWHRRR